MNSLFDNEYLGNICAEQHRREIREEVNARQLAYAMESAQSCRPSKQAGHYLTALFAALQRKLGRVLTASRAMKARGDSLLDVPIDVH